MTEDIIETVADSNASEKLSSILNWVEETAKNAEAFAVEQTPLYIQELLSWNFWSSLIWCIFGIIVCITGVVATIKYFKWVLGDDGDEDSLPCFFMAAFIVFGASFTMIFSNFSWLQISVAPRVWLVEYVASKL